MLKLIDTCVSFNKSKVKCAEVFCHTADQFSIVCVQCEMKTFDFNDFWMHFKNMHLTEHIETSTEDNKQSIKQESDEDGQTYSMIIKPDVLMDYGDEENKNVLPTSECIEVVNTLDPQNEDLEEELMDDENDSVSDNSYENMTSEEEDDDNEEYIPKILSRKTKSKTQIKPGNDTCSSNSNNYSCKECNKIYKSEKMFAAHMDKKHNPNNLESNLKCNYCNDVFEEARSLKAHVAQEHRTFPCPHCTRVYKSNHLLRLHLYSHSGERRFKCDHENCDKAFFNPKLLSSHKRMVHVLAANFVCEMCGYRTKSNSVLEVHKRSHTGEKPCICKTCGKGFASQSLLSEHQPIHSSERPYGCEVCGASFSRPKALYHHKHLHLGIKKFVCKICGKAYAQAAGLSGHMRHHKAELSMSF